MTNAELIQTIRAEIERRKEEAYNSILPDEPKYRTHYKVGKKELCEELLSFLSTLESEEPVQDELEKEMDRFFETMPVLEHENIFEDTFKNIARHFAKWGAEHAKIDVTDFCKPIDPGIAQCIADHSWEMLGEDEKPVPNDLEEAARHSEILTYPMPEDGDIEKVFNVQEARVFHEIGFIAGAKWQADHTPLPEDTVLFNKGVEEGKRLAEEEQADLFTIVALDAAQRAKEQMMKDGLDAVKSGQSNKIEKTIAGVFVKYGMDLQKEQMMNEAVEYEVLDFSSSLEACPHINIPLDNKQYRSGDKVRIIIVKED